MLLRNPLSAMFYTLVGTAALAPPLFLPVLFFPLLLDLAELPLFYGVAAFAIAGAVAGRSGTFPMAALAASFVGGFAAYAVFVSVVSPPVDLLTAAIHASVAAFGAWASAVHQMSKVTQEVRLENAEKRRCRMCGARVGPRARRCWSCRASLSRIV